MCREVTQKIKRKTLELGKSMADVLNKFPIAETGLRHRSLSWILYATI